MPDDIYIPQAVNPHQGLEWQLMQKGEKHIALFALHHETLPDEFAKDETFSSLTLECIAHQQRGTKKRDTKKRRRGAKQLIFKIFFTPSKQQDAQKLYQLLESCYQSDSKITPDIERKIGQLLGYRDEDIKIYLQWVQQFQNSLYLPKNMPPNPFT
ncbi:MAG: hypothetical protein K0U39_02425 [Alphaproteobacteria bacterium]|nr:hypothetical protein [Alphaproteobacteria bacterium]